MATVVLKNITKIYPVSADQKKKRAKGKKTEHRISNLQMTDKGVIAVQEFSLDIADQEFIVLVGPSGCGKSTTLRMIAGLEDISGGDLFIDGELMNGVAPKDRDIAMVFQNYALYPHMSVYDNMAFSLKLKHMDKKTIDEKVREAAEILKLRQKINTTFIYVTHDQTEAMTLGDRIVIMKDGYIQQIGTPQQVFDHPSNLFVAGFIGSPQMNLMDGRLTIQNGKYTVELPGTSVVLSEEKQARLAAKNVPEQEVIVGVRPEHILLTDSGYKGHVEVSELMGSSEHLHLTDQNGRDMVVILNDKKDFENFTMGTEVNMTFSGDMVHVFSREDEKNLEW